MFPELVSLSLLYQHPDFSQEHQRYHWTLFGGGKDGWSRVFTRCKFVSLTGFVDCSMSALLPVFNGFSSGV